MAVGLAAVGMQALKWGPAIVSGIRGLRKHKNVDWGAVQKYINSAAPAGATPADYAEGERTTATLNEGVDAGFRNSSADATARAIRTGTLTSPSSEATRLRLEAIRARGRQFARRTGRSQVYQAGLGRDRFRQGLQAQMVGGRINEMVGGSRLADAASADALSSSLQYIQAIQGLGKTAAVPGVPGVPGAGGGGAPAIPGDTP